MQRIIIILATLLTCLYSAMAEAPLDEKVAKITSAGESWKRILMFVGILVIQIGVILALKYFYRVLKVQLLKIADHKLKSVYFHEYELLDKNRQKEALVFILNIVRWALIAILLILTVPVLFSIFPQTKNVADTIFSYILKPIKYVGKATLDYLPNLFTIIVIFLIMKYVIRFFKFMSEQVQEGKLKIPGFYQEWAIPTYHIARFFLWAFMVAMIYPYLPGADSRVFQGISVLMGLLVSFGSSAVISNFIAGFVITYMRPFVKGDCIKLNDTVGFVMEKTTLVTRIKTRKNEIVTIPNSFIMSAQTINYTESAVDYGLIIHSEVTIGYDSPWRKVQQLLIDSALATPGVSSEPAPFVLQTSLNDFYPVYQINAYIKDASKMPLIISNLCATIQDKFAAADVEIMSPHYTAFRNGNASTIPKSEQ